MFRVPLLIWEDEHYENQSHNHVLTISYNSPNPCFVFISEHYPIKIYFVHLTWRCPPCSRSSYCGLLLWLCSPKLHKRSQCSLWHLIKRKTWWRKSDLVAPKPDGPCEHWKKFCNAIYFQNKGQKLSKVRKTHISLKTPLRVFVPNWK